MGLFDKKYCDICGEKIGLFGNRKLEDGNMCKKCASKLSPWFSDRRHTDLAGIKEQLEYREENKDKVAEFHATCEIGDNMRVLVDEDAGTFMVTSARDLQEANPDVISLDYIAECNLDVDEEETELYREDSDGDDVPYDPPRYEFKYTFNITIVLEDHPFLDEIKFKLNDWPLKIRYSDHSFFGTGHYDPEENLEYRKYMDMADEIIAVLTEEYEDDEDEGEYGEDENGNEVRFVTCPYCGAKSRLTYTGVCEHCGGNLEG